MKLTNTLFALVLVISLGGVLYYLNKHPTSPAPAADAKKKVFSFQPDQVQEVAIEAPDQPSVTVRRAAPVAGKAAEAQWSIASPAGIAGDSKQIQSFVEALSKMEYTPLEPQTPSSLAEYGLDQTRKTFKVQLKQGQPVTLSVGKDNPGGTSKYAILSSTPGLFLLDSAATKDVVDKSLFDLRDKRVVPASLDNAKQYQLKFDSNSKEPPKLGASIKPAKIAVTKEANGNWELTDPAVRSDTGTTNYFLTSLTGAQMKSIEEENPKSLSSYGLDRPQIRVDITAPDGTHSLLVGKKKEAKTPETKPAGEDNKEGEKKEPPKPDADLGYYAKNSDSPVVFTITQALYDQLNQDLETYRSRFLFDFEASNARRIEVQSPEGELRLDKKGEDWFKAEKKMDAAKVTTFLDAVRGLRIEHFTEDKPGHLAEYGMDKPWMKVKVTYGEANKEETVLFGLKDKKFYATRQGAPSVYELSPTEPDTLQPKLKDLSS